MGVSGGGESAVECDFSAAEWKGLTTAERISRCRMLAEEAEQLAQTAPPSLKKRYKEIAAQWHLVVAELSSLER